MSISRRQFILGTAAGLILPSYYDKVFSYFENRGEPFIETPSQADLNLIAMDWGGGIIDFHLGEVATGPPGPMTLREYAERYFGGEQGYLDTYCEEREDVDFDEIAYPSMVETTWTRNNSAAQAHRLLESPFFVKALVSVVPGAGLEPALPFGKRILSPQRLPIPPPGPGTQEGWRPGAESKTVL
jgi:hypothetical protein